MENLTESEKYERYVEKAKYLTKESTAESLQRACRFYEKALAIKSTDEKIHRRLQKIRDYLKENEDPAEQRRSEVGGNDEGGKGGGENMIHVGNGFYLYNDLYDKLYLHQREGILFLYGLYKKGRGGVLGDDMGMGKTIQIVSFLAGMFDAGRIRTVLIIMPLALIINWSNEFEKWAPGINVVDYHSQTKTERARILRKLQRVGGVCLTSYGVVQKNSELLSQFDHRDFTWDYVILDEGHKVKNPGNKGTKAAHAIPSRNRLILSGTPLMNNLMELWAVFDWTHEGQLLGKMSTFKMEYNTPITKSRQKDATAGEQKYGAMLLENLRKKIAPYFLRRVKGDVRMIEARGSGSAPLMPDLPRKNDLICWVFLSPVQQQIYEMFRSSVGVKELLNTSKSPLTALVVLKKICDHARLFTNRQCMELGLNFNKDVDVDALDEAVGDKNFSVDHVDDQDLIRESGKMTFLVGLLDHLKQTGHRTLVFSLSRHVLDIIQKVMRNRGHKLVRLDGMIKKEQRQEIIDKFSRDSSITLFLLTTQVGGVGLTLTAADRVVVFDPSWNPATDSQAVDRVYRIGQTRNVVVYRLITCGTVEEKIYRRQIFKDTINRLMTGDSKNPHRYFSQQDLSELFQLGDPMCSATQVQLEQMYFGKRATDTALDQHLAFIHSLDMFGISDHDLMFSTDVDDDHVYDEESENFARNRVSKAEMLMTAECDENTAHVRQGGRYLGGLEMKVTNKAKQRASLAVPAAAGAAGWAESASTAAGWAQPAAAAWAQPPASGWAEPAAAAAVARPRERQEEDIERRYTVQSLLSDTDESRDVAPSQRPFWNHSGSKTTALKEVNRDLDSSLRSMSLKDYMRSSTAEYSINNNSSASASHPKKSLILSSSSDDMGFIGSAPTHNDDDDDDTLFSSSAPTHNDDDDDDTLFSSSAPAHNDDNDDDTLFSSSGPAHKDADVIYYDEAAPVYSEADDSVIVVSKKKSRAGIIIDDDDDDDDVVAVRHDGNWTDDTVGNVDTVVREAGDDGFNNSRINQSNITNDSYTQNNNVTRLLEYSGCEKTCMVSPVAEVMEHRASTAHLANESAALMDRTGMEESTRGNLTNLEESNLEESNLEESNLEESKVEDDENGRNRSTANHSASSANHAHNDSSANHAHNDSSANHAHNDSSANHANVFNASSSNNVGNVDLSQTGEARHDTQGGRMQAVSESDDGDNDNGLDDNDNSRDELHDDNENHRDNGEQSGGNDARSDDDDDYEEDDDDESDVSLSQEDIDRYQNCVKSAKAYMYAKNYVKALEQLKICRSISDSDERIKEYYEKIARLVSANHQ